MHDLNGLSINPVILIIPSNQLYPVTSWATGVLIVGWKINYYKKYIKKKKDFNIHRDLTVP